jgi:predicted DNA-binding transcriptional regulator AlpA
MEILGVSRTTWYRKLKELGLAEPDERNTGAADAVGTWTQPLSVP